NLLRLLERTTGDVDRSPAFIKSAVDNARSFRRADIRKILDLVEALRGAEPSTAEKAFLRELAERLSAVERLFIEDEELFDRLYGPLRGQPLRSPAIERDIESRLLLLRREEKQRRDMGEISKALRGRLQLAEARLEADQRRAIYATLALTGI